MKYIDIHGHMNFAAYDADREDVIKRAEEREVSMITVGTDLASSKAAIILAETHDNMWATVGMHPIFAGQSHNDPLEVGNKGDEIRAKQEFNEDEFRELAQHPKVVAIGECGLDYFHSAPEDIQSQREMFYRHIVLANEVKKPLMLHIRNGKNGMNAYQEAVAILRERANVRANFHFFAGNLVDLESIISINGTVSFTGVITFARNYDEVIRSAPLDIIMSETDCPYVSPIPNRGKRNEPSFVIETVKKIAEIRGQSESTVAQAILKNSEVFLQK